MISLTPATPSELRDIAALLDEMDRFYGATESEPLDLQLSQIAGALFGDPPAAYALLARDGATLIGLATYSFVWPAVGLTRSLYLKELYVSASHRHLGVGTQLMHAVVDVASKHRCSRVEWTTDAANVAAQRFYTMLGYATCDSKLFYREELEIPLPADG